ncbi:MAG: pseudaminic acid synthase [Bacteroidota bacterium]
MTPAPFITLNGRRLGAGQPVYLVAELSANHGHDLERAVRLVEEAKRAGADAIKLQTYTPDTLTIDSHRPPFQIEGTPWSGTTLYRLYEQAYTPWEWHARLQAAATDLGLDFFSTPFDDTAVAFLEELAVPAFKVASFENTHLPLLRTVARTGKPVILSTGMATLGELDEAVRTLREAGCQELVLLRCVSAYPAPPEAMHLRAIPHLADTFEVPMGLSDHTLDLAVPVAAATLGACLIEKHVTLSRSTPGPDAAFSLEPHEFKAMAEAVRTAQAALGPPRYGPSGPEHASIVFRRSVFVVEDVPAGAPLTPENIRIIRPGHGLAPRYYDDLLGRRAAQPLQRGTPLTWAMVGGAEVVQSLPHA